MGTRRAARGSCAGRVAATGGLLTLTTWVVGCPLPTPVTACSEDLQCPESYFCNKILSRCTPILVVAIDAAAGDRASADRHSDAGVRDATSRDAAGRDVAERDVAGRDVAGRDAASGDHGNRDRPGSDTGGPDTGGRDARNRDRWQFEAALDRDAAAGDVTLATSDAALGFDAIGACQISGTDYDYHQHNPANACEWCDPLTDDRRWTGLSGGYCVLEAYHACMMGSAYYSENCAPGNCVAPNGCCGGLAQPCCAAVPACVASLGCGRGGKCQNLDPCGELGQACCVIPADPCQTGVCSREATCVATCGQAYEACCLETLCSGSFLCCDIGAGWQCFDQLDC